jgi:beta-lactamase regulating signal transducer with metallopeptidase domain
MIPMLLDHLWQSTLFAAVVGILTLPFAHNSAAIRYWLWFVASVKFLVPFSALTALGATLFQLFAPQAPPAYFADLQAAAEPFSGAAPIVSSPEAQGLNWEPLLLALWALGFASIAAIWLGRWLKLRAALADASTLPMDAPMPVKSSASSQEPGLVGIWSPVLLLPQGIADHLSLPQMQTILAHEICHLRRRDNLLAAVHMGVEALFWFHPLVWWLGGRLTVERENACDESVLASGSDPQTYAESILKVCQYYMHSPLACASGVSGADLKRRIETIMENRIAIRLNALKKSLLATCAAAAIAAPLVLGLLTAAPAVAPAEAQTTNAPHPDREAALRRHIEGWEKKQPDIADMDAGLIEATKQQGAQIQKMINGWGALKSITFKGNDGDNDTYLVEFEKGFSAWTIGPLRNGKLSTIFFGPAIRRVDNGPSPGLEAAIRSELNGSLIGKPPYEIMSPGLQKVARSDLGPMSADIRSLGAVREVTFQKIDVRGWDVYHVSFANGTATVSAEPLKDGKLGGLLHSDISLPHAPPHPGTEAWLRRHIAAVLNGTPNYGDMKPGLESAVRRQWPDQLPLYKSLGSLQSLAFEGGGDHSTDVYLATFQNAKVRWHIEAPDASGKLNTLFFQKVD